MNGGRHGIRTHNIYLARVALSPIGASPPFYTYFANFIFRFATKPHTSYPILSKPRTWVAELIVRVGGSLVLIHVFAVFGGENRMLAGEVGHDPTTYGLTDRRYYQLSYTPIFGWGGEIRTPDVWRRQRPLP